MNLQRCAACGEEWFSVHVCPGDAKKVSATLYRLVHEENIALTERVKYLEARIAELEREKVTDG